MRESSYFARFETKCEALFRFDTRIYLNGEAKSESDGTCVAAVVGKNPGSARPANGDGWQAIDLDGDNFLPYVRNRFLEAYERAGLAVPRLAYVRVWNLFYLCDANFDLARQAIARIPDPPACPFELEPPPPIVWFAWGGSNQKLNQLKVRFRKGHAEHAFFFDKRAGKIVHRFPTPADFAKHPQGLKGEPIVEHLANLLRLLPPAS